MSPSTARRLTKWPDSYSTPFWGLLVGSSQGGQGKDSYRVDPGGNTELTLVSRPIRFSPAKICRSSGNGRYHWVRIIAFHVVGINRRHHVRVGLPALNIRIRIFHQDFRSSVYLRIRCVRKNSINVIANDF